MKQTQNTRVVSGGKRSGSVLAGESKGSGSHSGEWRGSDVLSCAREKATGRHSLACNWAGPRQDRKTPKPLLSRSSRLQPRYHARGARPEDHVSTKLLIIY